MKTLFATLSSIIGILAFYPYIRDLVTNKTEPHVFTWLIIAITQGSSAAIIWSSGGGAGAIALTIGTILTIVVLIISFYKGPKNITYKDTIVLSIACGALAIWIFLENPLLSIIILSAIDVLSYIPTFRKSYANPYNETITLWAAFIVANLLSVLALEAYNALTLTYLIAINVANISMVGFLLIRRKKIALTESK